MFWVHKNKRIAFHTYDHRETPNWVLIENFLKSFCLDGAFKLKDIDTNSDEYCVAIFHDSIDQVNIINLFDNFDEELYTNEYETQNDCS